MDLVFYHYESIVHIDENTINTNAYRYWGMDNKLFKILYYDYLTHIRKTKKYLKSKYNLSVYLKSNLGHTTFENQKKNSFLKKLINRFYLFFSLGYYYHNIPARLYKNKNIVHF